LEAHKADAGLSGRKIIWIVMGGVVHMVEAHSLVKTQQRWIEVVHIWLDYSQNLVGAGWLVG